MYGRARIAIYWIINLVDRQIEVYTLPRAGRSPTYRQRHDYRSGETLPVILNGIEIATLPVAELLP